MRTRHGDAIFPRSFARRYPTAVRSEGVYIQDGDGKRYLDACGGAAVVSIGHGVGEIAEVIGEYASRLVDSISDQHGEGSQ